MICTPNDQWKVTYKQQVIFENRNQWNISNELAGCYSFNKKLTELLEGGGGTAIHIGFLAAVAVGPAKTKSGTTRRGICMAFCIHGTLADLKVKWMGFFVDAGGGGSRDRVDRCRGRLTERCSGTTRWRIRRIRRPSIIRLSLVFFIDCFFFSQVLFYFFIYLFFWEGRWGRGKAQRTSFTTKIVNRLLKIQRLISYGRNDE